MLKSRYSQSQPRPFFHYPLPLSGCVPCSENPFNFSLLDSTLWSATAAPVHFRGILSCVSLSSGSQIFFQRNFPNQLFAVPLRTRVHLYIFKRRTHLRISCYLHSEGTQRTARRIFSSSTRQYNRSALTLGSSVAWLATNINGFHDPANSFRTLRTTTNEWEEERTI